MPHRKQKPTKEPYLIAVTWKNISACIVIATSIAGTAYTIGTKIQKELSKIDIAKCEQKQVLGKTEGKTKCLDKVEEVKLQLITCETKSKQFQEESLFFKEQYKTYYDRVQRLTSGKPLVNSTPK